MHLISVLVFLIIEKEVMGERSFICNVFGSVLAWQLLDLYAMLGDLGHATVHLWASVFSSIIEGGGSPV